MDQFKFQKLMDSIPIAGLPRELKAEIRVMWARSYFGLSKYSKAKRMLNDVLNTNPNYLPAKVMKAKILITQGEQALAKVLLEIARNAHRRFEIIIY